VKEISEIIRLWKTRSGEPLALATLVRAKGSSYRRPGARMLICADGTTVGSLSGGCLEEEVAAGARDVIRTGTPSLMSFDTRRRFGCNGTIEIFVERAPDELFAAIENVLRSRTTCTVETVFEPDSALRGSRIVNALEQPGPGASIQEIHPPIRLVTIGNGPDIRPFAELAAVLGWEIITIANITECDFAFDQWTAVIVATHNYGRDCAALRHLLPLRLKYVGLMGPRRRRDELLNDLLDSGVVVVSELFAPAGLHLEADSPEEIALSIVAEIQTTFASASAVPLRERRAPIHEPGVTANERVRA
jgi:xanthine/CO dehydrogenase XdhC/CoxF family maturation factor